jgi:hypothetical protein
MPEQTIEFVKALFASTTENPVYICSLGNERSGPHTPKYVSTRDTQDIMRFLQKWDQPERGLFFCVGTLKPGAKREKAGIAEIAFLHADIDFKDIDDNRQDVERKLRQLRLPPSIIVFSGNGIHAYWLLKEAATDDFDRIEAAYRLLADTVGGDMQVCEIARLMRLPGSHNSKQGAWTPVEIIELQADRRYDLDDIEEWLAETSPIVLRKSRPAAEPETNPFLAAAERLGFKPAIDVEKRLAGMAYMAGGDSAIHATQLAVSASLLNQGCDTEEVVSTLLDATRAAAGAYGDKWNWRREETALRKMCATWLKKHPRQQQSAQHDEEEEPVVVNLNDARQAKAERQKQKKTNGPVTANHIKLGEAVVDVIKSRGEDLLFTPDGAYRYRDGMWTLEAEMRSQLEVELEAACRGLNIESGNRVIREARDWIRRNPDLWREEIEWDAHGKVPCRSGLIDPRTLELIPSSAEHFSTWRIEVEYDPNATCPLWEQMLADFLKGRPDAEHKRLAEVIQELLGAGMIDNKPRSLAKALVLLGRSGTGKSQILEVLAGLFSGRPITVPLDALEGAHGLMPFLKRLPWVLHEAFDQRKWHFSSKVKTIITGEPVSINIKNGPILTQRVHGPIFWGTNVPPQFQEATTAIVDRLVVIKATRDFSNGAAGVAAVARQHGFETPSDLILATELPGLFAWALKGLQRALQRGFIEQTGEIREAANTIRRDSNLVVGFIEECITFDPDRMVSVPDFCVAVSAWFAENKGEDRNLPANDSIGKLLAAYGDPRIAIGNDLRDKRRRLALTKP